MTKRVSNYELPSLIDGLDVVDFNTGERWKATLSPGGANHKFDPTVVGKYKVRFRLDWHDIDENGSPRLDADFFDLSTNRHLKEMKSNGAHHTSAQYPGSRIYEWNFYDEENGVERKITFIVTIQWKDSVIEIAEATDQRDAIVIKASDTNVYTTPERND